jgi:hypothetical protein
METKLRKEKMELIHCKLGFKNLFVVDSVGKSDDLALLWGEEIIVDIQNFSRRHINGVLVEPNSNLRWKFTGFYSHPEVNKRFESWELLRYLANLNPGPWLCLGDFNEVVMAFEKWGGRAKSSSQIRNFQTTLEFCELTDLGYRGPKYMWTNCQECQDFVKERLDRGMVNSGWRELFPEAEIIVEAKTTSDHAVLVLHLLGQRAEQPKGRRFRFKACWLAERGYQLNVAQGGEVPRADWALKKIKHELELLLDKEDVKWKQWAKATWLM